MAQLQAATIIDPADDPSITAQMYRDEAAAYPSVGKVSGSGLSGSGILISDRWVLTAGHISQSKTGGTFQIGGQNHTIQSTILHPGFTFSPQLSSDIGLLYLSEPVTGVQAAGLYDFADTAALIGKEAVWVGHGMSGTGTSGQQLPFDFRAFTNVIDVVGLYPDPAYSVPSTAFVSDFDRPDGSTNAPSSSPEATRLEGGLAPGDSGGGVFLEVDGKMYLIGIHSYQAAFTQIKAGGYGTINGATNVDIFLPWILEQTGIVAVPEPSALALSGAALLAFALRRRR